MTNGAAKRAQRWPKAANNNDIQQHTDLVAGRVPVLLIAKAIGGPGASFLLCLDFRLEESYYSSCELVI